MITLDSTNCDDSFSLSEKPSSSRIVRKEESVEKSSEKSQQSEDQDEPFPRSPDGDELGTVAEHPRYDLSGSLSEEKQNQETKNQESEGVSRGCRLLRRVSAATRAYHCTRTSKRLESLALSGYRTSQNGDRKNRSGGVRVISMNSKWT